MPNAVLPLVTSVNTLLDENSYPGELRAAAHDLREALGVLAEWDEESPLAKDKTELDSGLAIAPMDAARCVLDFQRTACFLRGTLAAIEAAHTRSNETVEVLYAGCGPLAPLAVALCHRVENVRFWPVDIHQVSIDSVARLVKNAGYEKHFGEFVVADAAQHKWPQRGHVAIAEVMLRGLEKEPQIAVTANLAWQLAPDGVIVPAAVRLEVQLFDPATEFDMGDGTGLKRVRLPVAAFLELRADTAEELVSGHEIEFDVQADRRLSLLLSTQITTCGEHILHDYDSGLTVPWLANELGPVEPGTRVRVRLVMNDGLPRLEVSKLS